VVVLEVVDGVDDDVVVEAAVVTGVVVVVTDGWLVVVSPATDDDVEPESVVAGASLLQPAIEIAMRITGTRRDDFTVGSLARFVTIT
jgi:hypothetical protein